MLRQGKEKTLVLLVLFIIACVVVVITDFRVKLTDPAPLPKAGSPVVATDSTGTAVITTGASTDDSALASVTGTVSVASSTQPCADVIDRSVMGKVMAKVTEYNDLDVWLSGNYDESFWRPRLETQARNLRQMRKWASELKDPCVRNAYLGWIAFYDERLDEAWAELREKKMKIEMEEYRRTNQTKDKEQRKYERNHAIPVPPQ